MTSGGYLGSGALGNMRARWKIRSVSLTEETTEANNRLLTHARPMRNLPASHTAGVMHADESLDAGVAARLSRSGRLPQLHPGGDARLSKSARVVAPDR